MIEVLICGSILSVLLYVVLSAGTVVTRMLDTNERSSDVTGRVHQNLGRISGLLRSASLTGLRVRSNGVWIAPLDGQPYDAARFADLKGAPTGAVPSLATARVIEFVRDPQEEINGADDNGNGLRDEGSIWLTDTSGERLCLASGVESFRVTKSERRLRVRISCGASDAQRRVLRSSCEQVVLLRNN